MIATSSQPGMFPVASSNNPLTLVHTLPPPGSTTVSVQSMHTMSSTSGLEVIPMLPEGTIPTIAEMHNGKKLYSCSYCDKQFGSRYNTSRHEKGCKLAPLGSGGNQPNANPILCPNCGKHFQTHDGMTRHLKKKCKLAVVNSEAPVYRWMGKKVHMCKYCGKQFSTKWNAIRHENLFHTSDETPLTSLIVVPYEPPLPEQQQIVPRKPERYCRFCGNYFSTKYNAIRHERICTRISSSTGGQIQNTTTTTEAKSTSDTPMIQSQLATVEIQSPATQTVQPTPQTPLQQQIVLHQRQQQQIQPTQQQQQTLAHQQLTQQIQQLQQLQQQQVQRQQQQQQHEVPQNHQQQIIVQGQNQIQQIQQHQQAIQQHQQQQTQPQQVQITSQQVVFVQPFHVCKFCNKQLHTKCDPRPVLQEDIQNGTINASTLQAASLQIQAPITPTVLTGVSLPMLATMPAHNITIPIQPQTQQQQRAPDTQQIVTQQHPQHVQHQQVQLQIQAQQVTPQQIAQQPLQQTQQIQQQQRPQMQPPGPQQQQTPQQAQAAPRAIPVPSSIQQKPHGCNYCNKHFATKWYLDQHVKIHTGQAVTCNVCSKSFVTRWHLDKHARVHLPGAKKPKRDSVQSSNESRFQNSSNMISESNDVQQNSINGGNEGMVTALPNFSMASDNRNQLQQQFGLSPMTQQEQNEK